MTPRRLPAIAALRRYADAVRAWSEYNIAQNATGAGWLTEEWERLDSEYQEASAAVPRWLAAPIRWRIFRRLDYFRWTGQA
jgi:hypothetical protein